MQPVSGLSLGLTALTGAGLLYYFQHLQQQKLKGAELSTYMMFCHHGTPLGIDGIPAAVVTRILTQSSAKAMLGILQNIC